MAREHEPIGRALAEWLPATRWFQGKTRDLERVEVLDTASLGPLELLLVAAVDVDGAHPRYFVPLVGDADGPLRTDSASYRDAIEAPAAVRALAVAACTGATLPTAGGGSLVGRAVTGERPAAEGPIRPMGAEQSNSSIVLDESLVLKVLRRLEPGIHPDVEVTAALTAAGFAHVPAQHGALVHVDAEGNETALAVVSDFVAGARDGWEIAVAETAALAGGDGDLADAADFLDDLEALGEVVAGLHLALAEVFGWHEAEHADAQRWAGQMRAQLEGTHRSARQRAPELAEQVDRVLPSAHALIDELEHLERPGRIMRIHGDLHMGQVMRTAGGGWTVLDFEGEPAKSIEERRAPSTPVRDIAGVLRSFDYAAAAPSGGSVPGPGPTRWRTQARQRFLAGYVRHASSLLPGTTAARTLLRAFELDKAVYELAYELGNRPDWAPIPAGGILRVLDARREDDR